MPIPSFLVMLVLETAGYLGNTKKKFSTDDIYVCLITYSEPDCLHGAKQWHAHKNAHLTFFVEGGTVESRKNYTLERLPGEVAFYHAGEAHLNAKTRYPSKNLNLEVGPAFLNKYNLTDSSLGQTLLSNHQVRFNLLKLYKELLREDINITSLHMILLEILQAQATYCNAHPKWMKLIKEYLSDNWDETPTLEQLSQISGVHPVTISKNFTRYFHCTLSEYMRKIKVEKAIALIKSSKHTLEEIGFICGFAEKSHFTRVFKELTGFLPGEYRRL